MGNRIGCPACCSGRGIYSVFFLKKKAETCQSVHPNPGFDKFVRGAGGISSGGMVFDKGSRKSDFLYSPIFFWKRNPLYDDISRYIFTFRKTFWRSIASFLKDSKQRAGPGALKEGLRRRRSRFFGRIFYAKNNANGCSDRKPVLERAFCRKPKSND